MEQSGGPAVAVAEEFGVEGAGFIFGGILVDGNVLATEEELEFFEGGDIGGFDDGFGIWEACDEFTAGLEDIEGIAEETGGFPAVEVFDDILGEDFLDGVGGEVEGEWGGTELEAEVGFGGGVAIDIEEVFSVVATAAEVEFFDGAFLGGWGGVWHRILGFGFVGLCDGGVRVGILPP